MDFASMSYRDLVNANTNLIELAHREYSTLMIDPSDFQKTYEIPDEHEKEMDKLEDQMGKLVDKREKLEQKLGIEEDQEKWEELDLMSTKHMEKCYQTIDIESRNKWMASVISLEEHKHTLNNDIATKQKNEDYIALLDSIEMVRSSVDVLKEKIRQGILSNIYNLRQDIVDMESNIGVDMGVADEEYNEDDEFVVNTGDDDDEGDDDELSSSSDEFVSTPVSTKRGLMELAEQNLTVDDLKTILNKKGIKRYLVLTY
jgi:hypothetical protein